VSDHAHFVHADAAMPVSVETHSITDVQRVASTLDRRPGTYFGRGRIPSGASTVHGRRGAVRTLSLLPSLQCTVACFASFGRGTSARAAP